MLGKSVSGKRQAILRWVGYGDFKLLLSSLALVLALCVFFLSAAINGGRIQKLDERILLALREQGDPAEPLGPEWLQEAVRDVTALGGVTVLIFASLTVAGAFLVRRQFHAVFFLCAAMSGALLLNYVLKEWFARPRPELVAHLMRASTPSFPSGHSLLSAVGYLTIGSILARLVAERRLKIYFMSLAIVVTLMVGVSRIYLGVHYPSDVVAGWAIGLSWAIICWRIAQALQRRGSVEPAK